MKYKTVKTLIIVIKIQVKSAQAVRKRRMTFRFQLHVHIVHESRKRAAEMMYGNLHFIRVAEFVWAKVT